MTKNGQRKTWRNNMYWAVAQSKRWAAHPLNPSVADHMYRQGSTLLPNDKRGAISPLGGVATETQTEKEQVQNG